MKRGTPFLEELSWRRGRILERHASGGGGAGRGWLGVGLDRQYRRDGGEGRTATIGKRSGEGRSLAIGERGWKEKNNNRGERVEREESQQ